MLTSDRTRRPNRHLILLIAILALGAFLRAFGLWWDDGLYLHPDERFIAIVSSGRVDLPQPDNFDQVFDPAHSPLNPRRDGPDGEPLSFAYGSLPIYVQSVVSWGVNQFTNTDYQSYQHLYRVGRILNVLLDTLTILLVYLIGRRLFGRSAGLVAAAFYALAVLPIQLSHFFTVDVWLTSFVTAALYFSLRFLDAPSLGRGCALGVAVGCAFATKASVPSLIVPLLVVAVWTVWTSPRRLTVIGYLAIAALLSLAVFTLFEPYALVRRGPFIEDIRTQARIVRGQFDVPFTRQFVGLTPGVYELRNLFLYTVGPGPLLAAFAGIAFAARRFWRKRDIALLVPLTWIVAYVPTLLITEARFLRYTLPLIPVLAVLAAGSLVWLARRFPTALGRAPLVAALVVTAVWALGFSSIYEREHPRIAASRWMATNIAPEASVTAETWDDALPLPHRDLPPPNVSQISFDLYSDRPPEETVSYIAETLQSTDYVILSSDRIKDSLDNLPWRYAVQNEYYRRLLDGQLGFQLVYDAELRPVLFGIEFGDAAADESFTVYDHPHVRIFQKVEPLSTAEIRNRLLWGIEQSWIPQRYSPEQQLTFGDPVEGQDSTRDAGWNSLAVDNSFVAIFMWLLVVEAIGLATLPLTASIFARMHDRGAFSARLFGLVLLGWIGWIAGSIGLWESRSLNIAMTLMALAGMCWGGRWLLQHRGQDILLPSGRMYATGSAIWLSLFAVFLLLRAIYPDFWQTWFGGEKPFELAYLRAVSASTTYPPYDPWYADGTVNYYYYGWHLVATIAKLSGVGVSLAFQLASASFAALLGLQLAALGGWLARSFRPRSARPVRLTSVLVVIAALFVGNLDALRQIIEERGVRTESFDFWRGTRVIDFTINEFPYFSALWADLHPHVINLPILALLLTLLTGAILSIPADRQWPFPPITCGAIAMVLGTIAVTNAWDAPLMAGLTILALGYAGFLRSARMGLAGVAVGGLTIVGAYALFLPFFRGFYSVVQGANRASSGSDLGQFLTVWGIFISVVALVTLTRAARRHERSGAATDGVAFGLLVVGAAAFGHVLALFLTGSWPRPSALIAVAIALSAVSAGAMATRPGRYAPIFVVPVAALAAMTGVVSAYRPAATVALTLATVAAMFIVEARRVPVRAVPWALIALGFITVAGTEVMYVADDLQNSDWERMNTVFKFYLQAWLLIAIGSAALLAGLWHLSGIPHSLTRSASLGLVAEPLPATRGETKARVGGARVDRRMARISAIAGSVALGLGLLYPVIGTPVRLDWDMPSSPSGLTFDGYAWMNGGQITNGTDETIDFTGDLAAINWLNANVTGTQVILEASIGPYRGNGARISSATGLPTVLGWDRHQRQQRYEPGISKRMLDVKAIYNETDAVRKLEMLRRYNVRFIIVGDVERLWNTPEQPDHYASSDGLAAFDTLIGSGLSLVFTSGSTSIYEVEDFPSIPPAVGASDDL